MVELGIVLEEMGRALVCAPYFSSAVLAATAIMNAGHPGAEGRPAAAARARRERRRPWPSPSRTGAGTPRGDRDDGDPRRRPVPARRGQELRARRPHRRPDLVVSPARPARPARTGLSFFTVRGDAPGLDAPAAEERSTRPASSRGCEFARRRGRAARRARRRPPRPSPGRWPRPPPAWPARWSAAPSGCASSALDYANLRMQFGRPIASFQIDEAQAGRHAARGRAGQVGRLRRRRRPPPTMTPTGRRSPRWPRPAASEAYLQTAIHTIQIHGGIGFTWDNDTHLWFKRAKSSEVFLGDPTWHRERMLQAWGSERWTRDHERTHRSVRPRRGARLAGGQLGPRAWVWSNGATS